MYFLFRANFDSFCEILDHLEQFWGSDHYGAGLLQISKKSNVCHRKAVG